MKEYRLIDCRKGQSFKEMLENSVYKADLFSDL